MGCVVFAEKEKRTVLAIALNNTSGALQTGSNILTFLLRSADSCLESAARLPHLSSASYTLSRGTAAVTGPFVKPRWCIWGAICQVNFSRRGDDMSCNCAMWALWLGIRRQGCGRRHVERRKQKKKKKPQKEKNGLRKMVFWLSICTAMILTRFKMSSLATRMGAELEEDASTSHYSSIFHVDRPSFLKSDRRYVFLHLTKEPLDFYRQWRAIWKIRLSCDINNKNIQIKDTANLNKAKSFFC